MYNYKKRQHPYAFLFLNREVGLKLEVCLKSMKNIHIYRFLERHLAEDIFSEVCSILANTNIPTEYKYELLAEKYWPRLDYIKADILIKKYTKGKNNGNKK